LPRHREEHGQHVLSSRIRVRRSAVCFSAWTLVIAAARLTDGPKRTSHDAGTRSPPKMAERGLSSSDVAEVLGHTSAGITERIYTHAFNRDEREQRVRQAIADAMSG
jgi:integrase